MQTVAELFRRLEELNLRYAVLRNYEFLPDLRGGNLKRNTDIDMVVDSNDLPRFRELVTALAAEFDWNVLTECQHFQKSRARHHNIEIFQFYKFAPLDYLQIDVFHGYISWGLPLMDEQELLQGVVHDPQRGLSRIDPGKENTFRLLQIHGLGQDERTAEKRARYQAKFDRFLTDNPQRCMASLGRVLGRFGIDAAAALCVGDNGRFLKAMARGKAYFFAHYALRNPLSTLWQIAERFRENRVRFHGDPCGCLLKVHAATGETRRGFQNAMGALIQLNVLDEWVEEDDPANSRRLHNVLEQGGIVVRWTNAEDAAVVVEAHDEADEIAVKVLSYYVRRHQALYLNLTRHEVSAARS